MRKPHAVLFGGDNAIQIPVETAIDEIDDFVEELDDDDDEFDRQLEIVDSSARKKAGVRQIVSARTGETKKITQSIQLGKTKPKYSQPQAQISSTYKSTPF